MKYGQLPIPLGDFPIKCEEIFFYQYLPIKMAGKIEIKIPENLKVFESLITTVYTDIKDYVGSYIYITAKHLYVTPQYWGNRPGYHTDGFMTDDINYIWSDCNPTIFNKSEFKITPDHLISLKEFEEQALEENEIRYPNNFLLKLDQSVVHKVAPVTESRFRTFVKISVSKKRYNLKGNSHNYLFNYDWAMVERSNDRNDTTKKPL
jgi:hypothetical protein